MRRVLQEEHSAQACDRCLAQLGAYVDAQLAGEAYLAMFPEVAAHLDGCLECAGAYARLYELEAAARTGTLPERAAPAADLSFLARAVATPGGSVGERLAQALRRTADGLTLQLSEALLALLGPGPLPAAALRSTGEGRFEAVVYRLTAEQLAGSEPAFSLVVYRDAQAPERGLVEVQVQPEGLSWPDLGGYRVTLAAGGATWQAVTDAWGLASIEGVPLEALREARLTLQAAEGA